MTLREILRELGIPVEDYFFPQQDQYSVTISGQMMDAELATDLPAPTDPPPFQELIDQIGVTQDDPDTPYVDEPVEPQPGSSYEFHAARDRHNELARGVAGEGEATQREVVNDFFENAIRNTVAAAPAIPDWDNQNLHRQVNRMYAADLGIRPNAFGTITGVTE